MRPMRRDRKHDPNSGNTARSPLHLGPSADDSVVTATVSTAPAIMRPVRSLRLSGATLAMALLRGRNVCPNATAISAAAIAHTGDAGIEARAIAATSQLPSPAVSAMGQGRDRQVHA